MTTPPNPYQSDPPEPDTDTALIAAWIDAYLYVDLFEQGKLAKLIEQASIALLLEQGINVEITDELIERIEVHIKQRLATRYAPSQPWQILQTNFLRNN